MKYRHRGTYRPQNPAIGLGGMSFAGIFGLTDDATSPRRRDARLGR